MNTTTTHSATVAQARLSLAHDGAAASGAWDSAFFCVDEARQCLSNAEHGIAHPGGTADMWVDSALMWAEKAAQHVWGFSRPAGW
jgi:hypothetical protein